MSGGLAAERGLLSGRRTTCRPRRTTVLTCTAEFAAPREEVFAFCVSERGFRAAMPGAVRVAAWPPGGFREGAAMAFHVHAAGVRLLRWVGVIEEYRRPEHFVDLQTRGAFRYFRHTHRCAAAPGGGTRYSDHVEFATRLGPLLDRILVRPVIDRAFRARLDRMKGLLDR